MKFSSLILFSLLFLFSCQTYNEKDKKQFDTRIKNYISKNKLDLIPTGSGLYMNIDTAGNGAVAQYGDQVTITYSGKLLNGQKFDEKKEPVTFYVKDLIAGWKEALLEMKVGDKATLIIPPQLGYGDHKLNDIPPNSILYYELELHSIK